MAKFFDEPRIQVKKTDLPFLPTAPGHTTPNDAPALCDDAGGDRLTYGALRREIQETAAALNPARRALVLCAAPRSCAGAVAYLGAAQAGHAVFLIDPAAPDLSALVRDYRPEWIFAPPSNAFEGYARKESPLAALALFERRSREDEPLHPDLYLLLSTSGSTGGPKSVRLSYRNLAHNTKAIVETLGLTGEGVALGHLPLAYSFGLSVLHAQLAVGGRCVLTERGLMEGAFWDLARERKATLFPGVPYHYEMLARLGLERLKVPDLKVFLQAGGGMSEALTRRMLKETGEREGGQLFIMYGQTEAAPRMACLPLHERPEKLGSAGRALPEGRFSIEGGAIIYEGPNVMMGRAESRADLSRGDETGGRLETGDLGRLDAEGYLTVTGRAGRFAKLYGQRIALDELERLAAPLAFAVAVEGAEKIVLFTTGPAREIAALLAARTALPPAWIEVRSVDQIPLKPNGKVDYQALETLVCGES